MPSRYFLSKHAHVCACEGDLILLDLRSGKYIGLNPALSAALAPLVPGWPAPPDGGEHQPIDRDDSTSATLRTMLDKGVLTTVAELGKDASPVRIASPVEEIADYFAERPPPIRLVHVIAFLKVVIAASLAVRFVPLRRIVDHVTRRRAALGADTSSPAAAGALVSVYNRLRLVTFSAKDRCFFDSLVLLEFLLHFRMGPLWVFGVQSSPFLAHCWVQHDATVLNDTPHHVGRFTPIMIA